MKKGIQYLVLLGVTLCLLLPASAFADSDSMMIQELKKMVEAQQQQIDMLKAKIEAMEMKSAPMMTEKESAKGLVKSRSDKVQAQIYGQVNRGVLIVDDGNDTEVMHVDNDNSSTRLGFTGNAAVSDDFSVGAKVEVQFESNSTAAVSQADESVGPNNFTERHLDLFLQSKKAGKLSIGQGDTASNGTSEVDLSGTDVVAYSGVDFMAGGINYVFSDTGALSGISISDTMSNMDGFSRRDRLRYDTPSFAGFTLSGSLIEDERQDLAIRYSGKSSGFKLAAAAAFGHQDHSSVENQYNGSVSLLLNSGLNFTLAAGARDMDADNRNDPSFFYGKIGYQAKIFNVGSTNFAVDYGYFEDIAQNDDEATTFGVFAVQNLANVGTELYIGYRWHDLDRLNAELDSISAILIGSRVKF